MGRGPCFLEVKTENSDVRGYGSVDLVEYKARVSAVSGVERGGSEL